MEQRELGIKGSLATTEPRRFPWCEMERRMCLPLASSDRALALVTINAESWTLIIPQPGPATLGSAISFPCIPMQRLAGTLITTAITSMELVIERGFREVERRRSCLTTVARHPALMELEPISCCLLVWCGLC